MKAVLLKPLIIYLVLFTVVIKSGIFIISFFAEQSKADTLELLLSSSKNTSEETESIEDTVKEFWICTIYLNVSFFTASLTVLKQRIKNCNTYSVHHPNVPIPPPDTSV